MRPAMLDLSVASASAGPGDQAITARGVSLSLSRNRVAPEADASSSRKDGSARKAASIAGAGFLSAGAAAPASASTGLPIIMPNDPRYIKWYVVAMAASLLMAVFDPYNLAFVNEAGVYPYYNFWMIVEILASIIFVTDMVLKFFVALKEESVYITDHKIIAIRNLKWPFWVDLVTSLPWEPIVAGGMGATSRIDNPAAVYVALLRWLRIGRLYRIFDLFAQMQYNQVLKPMVLMLVRNYTYVSFLVHWVACLLYWMARADAYSDRTWVGRAAGEERLEGHSGWVRYLYALYFATGVFSGVGDETMYANSTQETILVSLYLMLNTVVQAYILGTITIVMVKADLESSDFRNSVEALNAFSAEKNLPKSLHKAMHEHLELQFYSEKTADEAVLKFYPSTIKQKVLRHLYLDVLRDCYLFAGCKARFLDQVLAVARMELFMPNVPVLSEGDSVNELMFIVDGSVHMPTPTMARGQDGGGGGRAAKGPDTDLFGGGGGRARFTEDGHEAGRARFTEDGQGGKARFTEDGQASVRVSVHKAGFEGAPRSARFTDDKGSMKISIAGPGKGSMKAQFDEGSGGGSLTRQASENSLHGAGAAGDSSSKAGGAPRASIRNAQKGATYSSSDCFCEVPFFTEGTCPSGAWTTAVTRVLILNRAAYETLGERNPKQMMQVLRNLVAGAEQKLRQTVVPAIMSAQLSRSAGGKLLSLSNGDSFSTIPGDVLDGIKDSLTYPQLLAVEQLDASRKLLQETIEKHDQLRMFDFLNAASIGDIRRLPALLGKNPDEVSATDYDKRSACMLAARDNQEAALEMLLKAGADTTTVDSFGYTALFEAVRKGNDGCIKLLLDHKAKLGVEPHIISPLVFQAVVDKDLGQLRRFLRVGANIDLADLDGRTPLHVCASKWDDLDVMRLLVEEGGATICVTDRWGRTPLDDARDAGHAAQCEYLERKAAEANEKWPVLAMLHQDEEGAPSLFHEGPPSPSKPKPARNTSLLSAAHPNTMPPNMHPHLVPAPATGPNSLANSVLGSDILRSVFDLRGSSHGPRDPAVPGGSPADRPPTHTMSTEPLRQQLRRGLRSASSSNLSFRGQVGSQRAHLLQRAQAATSRLHHTAMRPGSAPHWPSLPGNKPVPAPSPLPREELELHRSMTATMADQLPGRAQHLTASHARRHGGWPGLEPGSGAPLRSPNDSAKSRGSGGNGGGSGSRAAGLGDSSPEGCEPSPPSLLAEGSRGSMRRLQSPGLDGCGGGEGEGEGAGGLLDAGVQRCALDQEVLRALAHDALPGAPGGGGREALHGGEGQPGEWGGLDVVVEGDEEGLLSLQPSLALPLRSSVPSNSGAVPPPRLSPAHSAPPPQLPPVAEAAGPVGPAAQAPLGPAQGSNPLLPVLPAALPAALELDAEEARGLEALAAFDAFLRAEHEAQAAAEQAAAEARAALAGPATARERGAVPALALPRPGYGVSPLPLSARSPFHNQQHLEVEHLRPPDARPRTGAAGAAADAGAALQHAPSHGVALDAPRPSTTLLQVRVSQPEPPLPRSPAQPLLGFVQRASLTPREVTELIEEVDAAAAPPPAAQPPPLAPDQPSLWHVRPAQPVLPQLDLDSLLGSIRQRPSHTLPASWMPEDAPDRSSKDGGPESR